VCTRVCVVVHSRPSVYCARPCLTRPRALGHPLTKSPQDIPPSRFTHPSSLWRFSSCYTDRCLGQLDQPDINTQHTHTTGSNGIRNNRSCAANLCQPTGDLTVQGNRVYAVNGSHGHGGCCPVQPRAPSLFCLCSRCVCVYYCRTYYKAVCGWGGGQ